MNDNFFSTDKCDRCKNDIGVRTMSWFTDETICMACSNKEQEIKKSLPDGGKLYEGCGFIPDFIIKEIKK